MPYPADRLFHSSAHCSAAEDQHAVSTAAASGFRAPARFHKTSPCACGRRPWSQCTARHRISCLFPTTQLTSTVEAAPAATRHWQAGCRPGQDTSDLGCSTFPGQPALSPSRARPLPQKHGALPSCEHLRAMACPLGLQSTRGLATEPVMRLFVGVRLRATGRSKCKGWKSIAASAAQQHTDQPRGLSVVAPATMPCRP